MKIASNSDLALWKTSSSIELAFFGSGYICEKTIEKACTSPDLIIDNNPDAQGTIHRGISITSLSESLGRGIDIVYIITSTSISEITSQLLEAKVPLARIYVSPVLRDHCKITDFESQKFDLLFSSGLQNRSQDLSISGGGLYRIHGGFEDNVLDKFLDGASHGIKIVDECLYVINEVDGIVKLDRRLQVLDKFSLPKGLRPHGIDFCSNRREWIVACSYGDGLLILDDDFKKKGFVSFSKMSNFFDGKAQHHVNDVCVIGSFAYASMFSLNGQYKRGVYDGGVIIVDLESHEQVGSLYGDLSNPHNISFHNGDLWILDSFDKVIYRGSSIVADGFPSFLRGFDIMPNGTMLLGQSKNRNLSIKPNKTLSPTYLDTSIIVFDAENNVAKTIPLASSVSEIHAIANIAEFVKN